MKELFPAEWLPMRRTLIFFRGAKRDNPRLSAAFTKPEQDKKVHIYKPVIFIDWLILLIYKSLKVRFLALKIM